jgi:hypothetical protein
LKEKYKNIPYISFNDLGNTPKFLMLLNLSIGDYYLRGIIGTLNSDTAYLEIRLADNTLLQTISNSNTLTEVTSNTTFNLPINSNVYFFLYGSSATTVSFINSLGVYQI